MATMIIIMSVIVVFNIMVLFVKLIKKQYGNLLFDITILVGISTVLGGSTVSLLIGNLSSFIISIALYFVPMNKLFPFVGTVSEVKETVVNLTQPEEIIRDSDGYLHVKGKRAF